MPNHVHLIVAPETAAGLRCGIGAAHRRYTRRVNFGEGWRDHLWQGRFAPFVKRLGQLLGRDPRPKKRGPKGKRKGNSQVWCAGNPPGIPGIPASFRAVRDERE